MQVTKDGNNIDISNVRIGDYLSEIQRYRVEGKEPKK